jgi:hypothetical protein
VEPMNKSHTSKTPPPRVGTVPNAAVQRGPIALHNLLCARRFTQNLCPRNGQLS